MTGYTAVGQDRREIMVLGALALLALVTVPGFRALRGAAQATLQRRVEELEQDLGVELDGRLSLHGPMTLDGEGLTVSAQGQVLAEVGLLRARWCLLDLLTGGRRPCRVDVSHVVLHLPDGTGPSPWREVLTRAATRLASAKHAPRGAGGRGSPNGAWLPKVWLRDLVVYRGGSKQVILRIPLAAVAKPDGTEVGFVEALIPDHSRSLLLAVGRKGGLITFLADRDVQAPLVTRWVDRELTISGLGLSAGQVVLFGPKLSVPGGSEIMAKADELSLSFSGGVPPSLRVRVSSPWIKLETYPDGGSNFHDVKATLTKMTSGRGRLGGQVPSGVGALIMPRVTVEIDSATLELVRYRATGEPRYLAASGVAARLDTMGGRVLVTSTWSPGPGRGEVHLSGYIAPGGDLELEIGPDRLDLAALGQATGLSITGGELGGKLDVVKRGRTLSLEGNVQLRDAAFRWSAIASGPLSGLRARTDLSITYDLDRNHLTLGSLSATLGEIELSAWGGMTLGKGSMPYDFTVAMGPVPCRDIPRSLPKGLVPLLEGIEVEGHATVRVRARGDFLSDRTPLVQLDGEVDGFRIVKDVGPDLERLEGPFVHTALTEDGKAVQVSVDPKVPGFTLYRRISPYLRRAVVSSEDAGFYRHHGLDFGQIEASLERNVKEGRFARGGSTITQQVVKNLFLSKDKTLSRKLQEAYLSWRIEQVLTKHRILEIYLNIIEWGPGIYGARAAARYYFGKHPSELTIPEAAFLAAIIPNPRRFAREVRLGWIPDHIFSKMQRIIEKMHKLDYITAGEMNRALGKRPTLKLHPELPPLPGPSRQARLDR